MDDVTKQIQEEISMLHQGVTRYRSRARIAEEKQRASHQGAGLAALLDAVPLLTAAIKTECNLRSRTRYGRVSRATMSLREIPYEVSALITARTVLDSFGQHKKLTATARGVGARIEDEIRCRWFKKHDPAEYRRAQLLISQSQHYGYQRKLMARISIASPLVPPLERWGARQIIEVGGKLIELMRSSTGMVTVEKGRGSWYVLPTPALLKAIADGHSKLEILRPWFTPVSTKPKLWEAPFGGGYYSFGLPLVKQRDGSTQHVDHERPPAIILTAINAMQGTAWRVNRDVLEAMTTLWHSTTEALPEIPDRTSIELADRPIELPFDVKPQDMNPVQREMWKAWRRARARTFDDELRRKSKLFTAAKIHAIAEELRGFERFYYPYQLDWRGRAYCIPQFLAPQGPDLARGLLEFADGKALDTHESVRWFMVSGANHFGVDKVSFDDRIAWVEEHWELISETASDPVVSKWWMDASDPWQFLAWCLEAAEWNSRGRPFDFVSHKVVAMDGTCNGLQHYSAMVRDPVGGKSVNLTTCDVPQDIYQEVADVVESKLKVLAKEESVKGWTARAWLKSGLLGRSIVKRQVMTLPYGATAHGMQEQLVAYLAEVADTGVEIELEEPWDASIVLTRLIFESIHEVVVSAKIVMEWLQEVAGITSEMKLPLRWSTPLGLKVVQKYRKHVKGRVTTQILGRLILRIKDRLKDLSPRKQSAGVAPNFVHSLDSCHMMMTVAETERRVGPDHVRWAMIHDSYGCHAADAPIVSVVLREEFVKLYEERDVLAEFKADIERDTGLHLPDPPPRGDLDIREVLTAPYFFA